MRALILRRVGLIEEGGAGTILIGVPGSPDIVRLQGFLTRSGYPNLVLDAARRRGRPRAGRADRRAARRTAAGGLPERHDAAKRPSDAELAACLGMVPDLDPDDALRRRHRRRRAGGAGRGGLCRVGGPVGDRARRARDRRPGGRVEPDRELSGLPDRHLGPGAGRPRVQPGAEVRRRDRDPGRGRAARLSRAPTARTIRSSWRCPKTGASRARTVVVASGARYRRPDIPDLAMFEGAGISYWASPIEARLCAGEEVALVGGGNSAGQAVVFLAPQVKQPAPDRPAPIWQQTMSRYLIDRIAALPNVELHVGIEIVGLEGDRADWAGRGDVPPPRGRLDQPLRDAAPVPVHRRRSQCRLAARLRRDRRQGLRHAPAAGARRWRPACPACSRSATCAPVRPSASPRRSAKARRSSRRSTPRIADTARRRQHEPAAPMHATDPRRHAERKRLRGVPEDRQRLGPSAAVPRPAAMSAAATIRRTATRPRTSTPRAIRSSRAMIRPKAGAGAMSMSWWSTCPIRRRSWARSQDISERACSAIYADRAVLKREILVEGPIMARCRNRLTISAAPFVMR